MPCLMVSSRDHDVSLYVVAANNIHRGSCALAAKEACESQGVLTHVKLMELSFVM